MNRLFRQLSLAAPMLLAAGATWAGVDVTFVHPEKFTDLPSVAWERQQALDDIADHFKDLAASLPPGQDIKVEVLDVDLAGRERLTRFSNDPVRIRRGRGDWPRLRLHYALTQHGTLLKSGDALLVDNSYMDHINMYPDDERLRFEKQMIDAWWEQNIGPSTAARK